ncbi:MAG: exodeoxyribonuclease VII large subunit [Bacteroidaceae bacterium]|nr:exodeoxyribonuclease VII large subunit [Bacteroidaceae bacterium]
MTLYELNQLVQETIEEGFPDTYWVQGELSEGRAGYGGHFYGELIQRDEENSAIIAKARVNCWVNTYRKVAKEFEAMTGETLRQGLTVMLEVTVTFHPQYGYSLNILDIDPSYTLGDMSKRRQAILRQLEEDGILHDNQALSLPLLMNRIAVVSSSTAAGYGDFCNQLEQNEYGLRFQYRLFPALMQGGKVEESVTVALTQIAEEADQWDAVVIIRGGGATSDLSDFDSYPLAACIAQFPLPVITGIGHERDETVLDYVAHTHLKTPTAVAAFLIEHQLETATRLEELQRTITSAVTNRLVQEQQHIARLSSVLPLAFRSVRERQEHRLQTLLQRLNTAHHDRSQRESHCLDLLEQQFRSFDPALLLRRGYSITLVDGRPVRDVARLKAGQQLTTRVENGEITSIIQTCKKN